MAGVAERAWAPHQVHPLHADGLPVDARQYRHRQRLPLVALSVRGRPRPPTVGKIAARPRGLAVDGEGRSPGGLPTRSSTTTFSEYRHEIQAVDRSDARHRPLGSERHRCGEDRVRRTPHRPPGPPGKDIENGARLAVDAINATKPTLDGKPVRFELQVEDDQADPKTATVVAQKLVDVGVKGVIGTSLGRTASRIYSDNGVPQVSPASTAVAYTHQGFKTTFRLMANDSQQGKALARMPPSWAGG